MRAEKKIHHLAIVDHDELFAAKIREMLGVDRTVSVVTARTGDQLVDLLNTRPIQCVILDYDLGDDDSFRVAELVWQKIRRPPPMIMLTGGSCDRTANKALRAGIFDYLTKGNLSAAELGGAIERAINADRWARFRIDGASRSAGPADYDAMTGFYSRAFASRYFRELNEKRRDGYGVVVMRIARFEEIRARWGLPVAEQVFRFFVMRLRTITREGDFWGRIGGASFICVTHSNPSEEEIEMLCERLRDRLNYDQRVGDFLLRILPAVGASLARDDVDATIVLKKASTAAREDEIRVEVDGIDLLLSELRHPMHKRGESRGDKPDAPGSIDSSLRAFKRAHILSEDPTAAIDCVIRGLSDCDATLRFANHYRLPQEIKVKIAGDSGYRSAALRWQRGRKAEVEFLD